eukprot:1058346-Prymnesium_polylepis.1
MRRRHTGCPPADPLPHPYETLVSWNGSRSYAALWQEPARARIGGFATRSDSHGRLVGSCCAEPLCVRPTDAASWAGV